MVLQRVGQKFLDLTRATFGPAGSYRGNTWPPLTSQDAKRVGSSTATLLRSGRLRNSIRLNTPRNNYIEVYTSGVPYATAHFFGNPKKKEPRRMFFPVEATGGNQYRLRFDAERILVNEISKAFYQRSYGAFPFLAPIGRRSTPTYGNVNTRAT